MAHTILCGVCAGLYPGIQLDAPFMIDYPDYEFYPQTANTYYVPFDENVPSDPALVHDTSLDRYSQTIQYYQWTPILLTFCAMAFAVPGEKFTMFTLTMARAAHAK